MAAICMAAKGIDDNVKHVEVEVFVESSYVKEMTVRL
jgi:hypothetical protein